MKSQLPNIPLTFEDEVRLNFIQKFVVQLDHLKTVFAHAEKYRATREEDILSLIKANSHSSFMEQYGLLTFREYSTIDLWYKPLLIQSLFLIAFSILEFQLSELATAMQDKFQRRQSIAAYAGKRKPNIQLFREYLKNVHKLKNAEETLQWNRIDDFRLIRNSIVHNAGKIRQNNLNRLSGLLTTYNATYNNSSLPLLIRDENFLMDFTEVSLRYIKAIVFEIAPI